jgi:FixJ family two-component response regulator
MRIQAMREGAVEFLAKPLDHQLLLKTVRAALDISARCQPYAEPGKESCDGSSNSCGGPGRT